MEDLKWAKAWYYTTISVSDMTWDVEGTTYTIWSDNISLKQSDFWIITWADDANVKCGLGSEFSSWQITFIYRESWTTGWLLWKYWAMPTIELKIPANTPAATYKWTITYTLIENAELDS